MYFKTRKKLIFKPAQIASPNMLLQEYQGIGERHPQTVAQMGRNPPAETPELLVKAVSFISDQLRDFYSDRNVQESSAEQRS